MDLLRLWRREPVSWKSPLTPESAAMRLEEHLTQRHRIPETVGLVLRGPADVAIGGWVTGLQFQVYAFHPGTRGSFQATLRGELVSEPSGGCRAEGKFAYPIAVRVVAAIWTTLVMTGLLSALGAALILAITGSGQVAPLLAVAGFTAGMLAFGALIVSIGSDQGCEGRSRLEEWVSKTLAVS